MAKAEEVWTQLATRIPKELHRRLKTYCVTHEIAVQDFVQKEEECLDTDGGRQARAARRPRGETTEPGESESVLPRSGLVSSICLIGRGAPPTNLQYFCRSVGTEPVAGSPSGR